jgi:hypothetical protein
MPYFVVVTFDIKDGSADDYQTIYDELETLGLRRRIPSGNGATCDLPTTTTAGEIDADNSSAAGVRDFLTAKVNDAFKRNGLAGRFFVSVAGNWAWGHRTP